MNQSVKWAQNKIITVREATVGDEIAQMSIRRNLTTYVTEKIVPEDPEANYGQWPTFALLCSQTVSSTGLAFQPEIVRGLTGEALYRAYLKFLETPVTIRDKWGKACEAANVIYDIELGPDPLPDGAEKKA